MVYKRLLSLYSLGVLNTAKNPIYKIITLSLLTYLLFFWKLLIPSNIIYSGKDSIAYHYPSKIYLSESLKKNIFPFWSENIFLGFPLYADLERGYQNPINILLVKFLGPFDSYKLLHFSCYFIGSISLYLFLKKYGVSTWGFLATNSIYFFSFFSLYHQQHFNMILTYYLFPLGLLLMDKILAEKKLRYAVYNSLLLAFCFYFGSFQFILIFILLEVVYLFSNLGLSKKFLFYSLYTFVLFLVLSLPGVFSTYTLFSQSERSSSLEYTQGSYSPAMFINVAFPFIFNFEENYMGSIVSTDYFMQETYTYTGVSTLVFSILGYAFLKDKKLKIFIISLLSLFFILAFIKYIPIVGNVNLLPISLFRYWGRSIVFLNLSFSILVYIFIVNLKSFHNIFNIKNLNFLLYPLLYLVVLESINIFKNGFVNTDVSKIMHVLFRNDYVFGYWYYLWFGFLMATFFILFINKFRKTLLISLLIFLDITVFGLIGVKDSLIKTKQEIFSQSIDTISANTRVLDLTGNATGDNALIHSSWSLFGYSVLYPASVSNEIYSLGFKSLRYPILRDTVSIDSLDLEKIKSLGISRVIYSDNTIFIVKNTNYLVDDSSDIQISNYVHTHGYVSFDVVSMFDINLSTYIRNHPGWKVFVDNTEVIIGKNNTLFVSLPLFQGIHNVKLYFVPSDLYNGIKASVILLTVFLLTNVIYIKGKKWIL